MINPFVATEDIGLIRNPGDLGTGICASLGYTSGWSGNGTQWRLPGNLIIGYLNRFASRPDMGVSELKSGGAFVPPSGGDRINAAGWSNNGRW